MVIWVGVDRVAQGNLCLSVRSVLTRVKESEKQN